MGQKCVKIGQLLWSIGTKESQTGTAYHAILIGLSSSNNLRWLNILIKLGTISFGGFLDYYAFEAFSRGCILLDKEIIRFLPIFL